MAVQRGDPVVVEGRGAGAVDRHVLPRGAERVAVAHQLAGDVAAGVVGAAALELVDRHDVGEVQHVDLLELRRRPELGRHDVERGVDVVDDAGVALADARRLDDHEVDARGAQQRDRVAQVLGQRPAAAARGHRAEVDLRTAQGVHADAVAEQRAAALAAGGVDGEHRDAELVLLVEAEAAHQLVGQRRLARAPGAGDAEDGDGLPLDGRRRALADLVGQRAGLGHPQRAGQRRGLAGEHPVPARRRLCAEVDVAGPDHRVDHPGQAQPLAVGGGEDVGDAVGVQPVDLLLHDDAPATAVDLDVACAALAQEVDEVREVLDVAALVGADGDAVGVLLDGGRDDLVDRAVVPEVDHLRALALQDAPHDVDRRVVPVEQARRGDEADGVGRDVQLVRHRSSQSVSAPQGK